jgi:hypothetical protein
MNNNELKEVSNLIKGDIYKSIRQALVSPDEKTKHSIVNDFVPAFLKEAVKNPTGVAGQYLAKQLFQDDIISSLDAQTEKLLSKDIDFLEYRIMKQLFKEQREVFLDTMVRRKCIMCSRRAGKTELNARLLVRACAIPNSPCLYVNLTFANAINQTFDKILECAKAIELPVQSSSKADGFIIFANGSSITFKGNTNKAEADKIRGYKYRLAIIDEAQSQVNMPYLINEVVEPLLMDFADSVMILTGTPPRVKNTYFEKAWNSKGWQNYHWTMFENPYIPNAEEQLEKICEEKGLGKESDFIQREYYGVIAYDTEAQVFKDYKTFEKVPDEFMPTDIVIGVDFGFSDYNGVVSLAFNKETMECYAFNENKFNKSTSSAVIECVKNHYENAKMFMVDRAKRLNKDADLTNITIVTDSNEKAICYELSMNNKLPAYPCYKYDKVMAISQLSDWCRTGKIKVLKDGYLAEEFDMTVYKRDDNDNITSEIDDSYHPDIADALLYASRQMWFAVGAEGGGISKDQRDAMEYA